MEERQFKCVTGYSAILTAYYCLAMNFEFIFKNGKTYFEVSDLVNIEERVIKQSFGRAKAEEFLAGAFTEEYIKNNLEIQQS